MNYCIDCSCPLTLEEKKYYGIRCEDCEAELAERIDYWLDGDEDEALDYLFGA